MEGNVLLISEAAKEVRVEPHVLRYWEEELHLPIKRNELGHRYYTREDVARFCRIKEMKDKGLQLKAIRTVLQNGAAGQTADVLQPVPAEQPVETREEKAKRFQWVLTELIRRTMQENNEELARSIRDSVVKELDYQFRLQEEREEKRESLRSERSEEYYRRLDELLRSKGSAGSDKSILHKVIHSGAFTPRKNRKTS